SHTFLYENGNFANFTTLYGDAEDIEGNLVLYNSPNTTWLYDISTGTNSPASAIFAAPALSSRNAYGISANLLVGIGHTSELGFRSWYADRYHAEILPVGVGGHAVDG